MDVKYIKLNKFNKIMQNRYLPADHDFEPHPTRNSCAPVSWHYCTCIQMATNSFPHNAVKTFLGCCHHLHCLIACNKGKCISYVTLLSNTHSIKLNVLSCTVRHRGSTLLQIAINPPTRVNTCTRCSLARLAIGESSSTWWRSWPDQPGPPVALSQIKLLPRAIMMIMMGTNTRHSLGMLHVCGPFNGPLQWFKFSGISL